MHETHTYASLRCKQGESAAACIERAKDDGLLPMTARKGGIKRNRWGYVPAPAGSQILGDVTVSVNPPEVYYILA